MGFGFIACQPRQQPRPRAERLAECNAHVVAVSNAEWVERIGLMAETRTCLVHETKIKMRVVSDETAPAATLPREQARRTYAKRRVAMQINPRQ